MIRYGRFPPPPEEQATLANWRAAQFNRWAFHHVREIVPSADIPNDWRNVWKLAEAPRDLPLGGLLEETDTDAMVVLHRGRLVLERYPNQSDASPHILMSVSKSMLGLLAGILSARGLLIDREVTDFVPEVKDTAYRDATIRQLLDMRAGVAFNEDYWASGGPMIRYRKATGWNPREASDGDLRSYFSELKQSDGRHGGRFHYISPNTDLLGWVIERAAGQRYPDLMSELLWKPMGAERSAYITVDPLGAPRAAGGMCATARDLARVGQLIVEDGRGIVPASWIDDLYDNGDPAAWDAGSFVPWFPPGLRIHYRTKWYVLRGEQPLLFGLGVHGQYLFVDRAAQVVIAKFSSQVEPLDAPRIAATLRMVDEIRNVLRAG